MLKKAAAVMLIPAICISGASCSKSKYRTSGKPYINDEPKGPMGKVNYRTYEKPAEEKRLITYEEMSELSREELGLDKEVYEWVYTGWLDRDKGRNSIYNQSEGHARKCDVILFGGNFGNQPYISNDKNFRIYVDNLKTEAEDTGSYQYYAVFIRTEFKNIFPQD